MGLKVQLESRILDMEKVAKAFDVEPFDIFFLGGSACILGDYTDRATRDFDFIDLDYPSEMDRVFALLMDFDMLEFESTLLSPNYKERSTRLEKFKHINVYLLSPEDIIVSKIIRMEEKDIFDIDELMKISDRKLIGQIINEVLTRDDLFESKKKQFLEMLIIFRKKYNV